ncbi:MAG TPA: hypothetical protein VMU93_02700 [Caulobacteraceae bacterium]|nr:hypothetical protein [Caulobacteraceae bacterium]
MAVLFEGFPRIVERETLRPGRWFVASEGARPLICLATEEGGEGAQRLVLTFGSTRPEALDFAPAPLAALTGPLATLEHEAVFRPGLAGQSPQLAAPMRRALRPGALLRLANGDLGVGIVGQGGGAPVIVSLATGARAEGYDLVFERWSLSLRRGGAELLVGSFRPV